MLAGGITIAGLELFRRGLGGYRTADRIADTGTSTISSIAVGEVRIAGTIEPAEVLLVSALQSVRCVYFRSTIEEGRDDGSDGDVVEERSIGFRVRDASGSVRVFPRGARFDAPVRFDASTDLTGDEPSGLDLRIGSATDVAERDREALIAELLRMPTPDDARAGRSPFASERRGRRHYRETRLEPGDAVTIIGRALPFGDLPDPAGANLGAGPDLPLSDPEIAADLAAARAAGTLHDDPAEAWGNAAIPGFGIGRPVSQPDAGRRGEPAAARGRRGRGPLRADVPHRARTTSSSRRRPRCRCSSPTARRPRRWIATARPTCWACSGPAWPSSVPCSSPSCSVEASERDPTRDRRRRGRGPRHRPGRVHRPVQLQRGHRAPATRRQGVGEHRRRPQAAPRHAAQPGVGGPRADGLRAGRPDRRHPGPRGVLPHRPDPRPGRDLGPDEPGGPVAVRRGRAVSRTSSPARTSWSSRPRSSGSRGSSRTDASSTTTRSIATTRRSRRSPRSSWRGSSDGARASSSKPNRPTPSAPTWS